MPEILQHASRERQQVLSIRKLHGWYGESHVLHGVELDVAQGEVVTLLGRNGAGKSSTLKAIMGILPRREGAITVQGVSTLSMATRHIARLGVAYVPEERGIYASLSVLENLRLPPVLQAGGMTEEQVFELFPNLYERRGSPGTKLSGGEQQMLAIGRVLRTGAKTLLLDEPTEGLAPIIVEQIGKVLALLKTQGYTIVLVEQNFKFATSVADRHYVMEEGVVADHFTNAEVLADERRVTAYVGV